MDNRRELFTASWSLVDQGIVSLGNFVLTIHLARNLPTFEYGVFALFLSANFAFQLVCQGLLIYPLGMRLNSGEPINRARLLSATLAASFLLSVSLGAVLVFGLWAFGLTKILPAALLAYLAWELNEVARRCQHADLRFASSTRGDLAAYLTIFVLIEILAWTGQLTLNSGLYAMSVGFVAGMLLHLLHLPLTRVTLGETIGLIRESFQLGKWAVLNEQISFLRIQIMPWSLALAGGPLSVASYQAALNLANAMNPLIIGVSAALPQAVAKGRTEGGTAGAVRAALTYTLLGLAPIGAYCLIAVFFPHQLLSLIYGSQSQYLNMATGVQILLVAWAAFYISQAMLSTLFGLKAGRLASVVNLMSLGVAVFALPLVFAYGAIGACIAVAIANFARVPLMWLALRRTLQEDPLVEDASSRISSAAT